MGNSRLAFWRCPFIYRQGHRLYWLTFYVAFLSLSREIRWEHLIKVTDIRIQIFSNSSLSHTMLYSLANNSVVKTPLKVLRTKFNQNLLTSFRDGNIRIIRHNHSIKYRITEACLLLFGQKLWAHPGEGIRSSRPHDCTPFRYPTLSIAAWNSSMHLCGLSSFISLSNTVFCRTRSTFRTLWSLRFIYKCLETPFVPHREHYVSTTTTDSLVQLKETTAVYSANRTKYMNAPCG